MDGWRERERERERENHGVTIINTVIKPIKVILGCLDKTHNLEAVLLVLMEEQNMSGTSYVIETILNVLSRIDQKTDCW